MTPDSAASTNHPKVTLLLSGLTFTGLTLTGIFIDEFSEFPAPTIEPEAPKRKQHGPVIKGKKGKIRRW